MSVVTGTDPKLAVPGYDTCAGTEADDATDPADA